MARFRWRVTTTGPVGPVTPVELFFDVVFVFTITQLTRVLEKGPYPGGSRSGPPPLQRPLIT